MSASLAMTYESRVLKWTPVGAADRSFNTIVVATVVVSLAIALLVSSIQLPEAERSTRAVVPERVAQFIMNKERPKAEPPKPVPQIEQPRAKPKPRREEQQQPRTDAERKARASAQKKGVLALRNELADLIDTTEVSAIVAKKVSRSVASTEAATVNTAVLAGTLTGSNSDLSATVEGYAESGQVSKTTLSQREYVVVKQSLMAEAASAGQDEAATATGRAKGDGGSPGGNSLRSEEDIAFIMDRNKRSLHSVYRQARRKNPGLKGRIIFDITILPSGEVAEVVVRSSDMEDVRLVERLIARIKQFDFGKKNGGAITVTYPVEFLPS